MNDRAHTYPPAEQSPNFPSIEKDILDRWKRERVFEASLAKRPPVVDGKSNEYVFYDGPPFANGLPHPGHLVTGFVKDLVPRYQTMRGRHVERRFGWDCHGLPAELEVEKETGVSGRNAILDWGIANFNAACRTSVQRFTEGMGMVRHARGALGVLRERLQDHGPLLHGERHVGFQNALGQRPRL